MSIAQGLHTFKNAIIGSLTDLNYYVEILNSPVRFSLKIVAGFYLLLGLFLTLVFTLRDLPKLNTDLDSARSELVRNYPADLTFDWRDGTLSSSATQQIVIPYPSSFTPAESAPKNLLLIDTTTDQAPDNANGLFYLNQKKFYINSLQGVWTDVALTDVMENDEDHLDKPRLEELVLTAGETQREILAVLPWLAAIVFPLGLFLLRMLMILIDALIVQLFFQLLNKPLAYPKVFQLCLHVLIGAELIHQFSSLVFPDLGVPMFGLAFWSVITLLLWHLRHLQVLRFSLDKDKTSKKQ